MLLSRSRSGNVYAVALLFLFGAFCGCGGNTATSPGQPAQVPPGAQAHSVNLSWTGSTSSKVIGYNIYRSSQSGGPYTILNSAPQADTSYADHTAQQGLRYYYVITAINSDSLESPFSNETTAVVPAP